MEPPTWRQPVGCDVLDESEPPAGNEDPADVGQHGGRVGDRAQHETADHVVDGGVGERDVFSVAVPRQRWGAGARHRPRLRVGQSSERRWMDAGRGQSPLGAIEIALAALDDTAVA